MNKFSIIIPTSNRKKYLLECLKNLQNQTIKAFEVFIINDFRKKIKIKGKYSFKINLINYCNQQGPGQCRNLALEKAKTRYSVFIDDDCFPYKNWAENIQKKIKSNPSAIKGTVLFGDKNFVGKYLNSQLWGYSTSREFSSTCNLIVNTAKAKKIKFDPKFVFAFEDVDFCKRYGLENIEFSSDIKIFHAGKESVFNLINSYFKYGGGNFKYNKKYPPLNKKNYCFKHIFNFLKKYKSQLRLYCIFLNRNKYTYLRFLIVFIIFILLDILKILSYKTGFLYEKSKN
ncbi:MAG: glycosyltransferase family 2 protein [Candidatus Muiribacteriota bacterium]